MIYMSIQQASGKENKVGCTVLAIVMQVCELNLSRMQLTLKAASIANKHGSWPIKRELFALSR